jgi:hypothetical protein
MSIKRAVLIGPVGNCTALRVDLPSWIPATAEGFHVHKIPQHQLLRVRMEVHLLVYPLGSRMAVQGRAPSAHALAEAARRLPQLLRHGVRPVGCMALPVVLDEA